MLEETTALADIPMASNAALALLKLEELDINNHLKSFLMWKCDGVCKTWILGVCAIHIELFLKVENKENYLISNPNPSTEVILTFLLHKQDFINDSNLLSNEFKDEKRFEPTNLS